jgi:MoaA/NifB/PqqE/SkfB family radical SAM enzyme
VDRLRELRLSPADFTAPKAARPEIGLEFVVMKRNLDQLPQLPTLATWMGASFIVVTNVLPYTEELGAEILYSQYAANSYPEAGCDWDPEIRLPRLDARPEIVEAVAKMVRSGTIGGTGLQRLFGARGHCRFVNEGVAAVGIDGEVSPCVPLMHSYPCYVRTHRKKIRRYTLGNVAEEPIGRIWDKDEYVAFRRRLRKFDFSPCTDCGGCQMSEGNEQDCFGNPFPVCGDCLWAKGVIQCP